MLFPHYALWVALLQTIVLNSARTRVLCKNESIDIFFFFINFIYFCGYWVQWNVQVWLSHHRNFTSLFVCFFGFVSFLFACFGGLVFCFLVLFWFVQNSFYLLLHQSNTEHIWAKLRKFVNFSLSWNSPPLGSIQENKSIFIL